MPVMPSPPDTSHRDSLLRLPKVAGQFYPASATELEHITRTCMADAPRHQPSDTLLAMVPHAGYNFSGAVAGQTLGQARLPHTLFLLGPNHTGNGAGVAVWPHGAWRTPLGDVPVHAPLAEAFCRQCSRATPDTLAHQDEHSLEVLLPFLQSACSSLQIVPIAIADPDPDTLYAVGQSLAALIAAPTITGPLAMIASTDMSHFVSHAEACRLDALALQHIAALDPEGLYRTVRRHRISMCGLLPVTAALVACRLLGASNATITQYTTSGQLTGDHHSVVGYAGALVATP